MILCRLQDDDQMVTPGKKTRGRALWLWGLLAMVLSLSTCVAAQEMKSEVVGHWTSANPSSGGIGSMWEFKSDGTLTMSPGVVVDMPYQIKGDKLILPPGTTNADAKPQIYSFRVDGDMLYERLDGIEKEVRFVRIAKSKSGEPSIVGTWKLLFEENPAMKDQLNPFIHTTYTYTTDGVCKLRVPFKFEAGTYSVTDSKSGTFTLPSRKDQTFAYRVADGKLYLTRPNGKGEDVYIRENNE